MTPCRHPWRPRAAAAVAVATTQRKKVEAMPHRHALRAVRKRPAAKVEAKVEAKAEGKAEAKAAVVVAANARARVNPARLPLSAPLTKRPLCAPLSTPSRAEIPRPPKRRSAMRKAKSVRVAGVIAAAVAVAVIAMSPVKPWMRMAKPSPAKRWKTWRFLHWRTATLPRCLPSPPMRCQTTTLRLLPKARAAATAVAAGIANVARKASMRPPALSCPSPVRKPRASLHLKVRATPWKPLASLSLSNLRLQQCKPRHSSPAPRLCLQPKPPCSPSCRA